MPLISPPASVAFLGLGTMGSHMASNLAKDGFKVRGWNRTPGKPGTQVAESNGVCVVDSISEAVSGVSVVFLCVGDVPDVEEVLLAPGNVCDSAVKGTLIVDTTTIGPDATRSIHAKLSERGFPFVDAPVTGGDVGAQEGTLTFMVGAEAGLFQDLSPCFEAMGKKFVLCGGVGFGQAVKLCNQVMCGLNMVALFEGFALAEAQGLDLNLIQEVCSTGVAGSRVLEVHGPRIVDGDINTGFLIKHMAKDLRLAQHIAKTTGKDLPGTSITEDQFRKAIGMGKGELATQAVYQNYLQNKKSSNEDKNTEN